MNSFVRFIFTAFSLLFLHSAILFAQDTETDAQKKVRKTPPKKLLSEARDAVRIEEYDYAMPFLLALDTLMPEDLEHHYLIGVSFMGKGKYKDALPRLQKASPAPLPFPDQYYFTGYAFHQMHTFDSAVFYYEKQKNTPTSIKNYSTEKIELLLRQCVVGKESMRTAKDVQVYNLGPNINSEFPDFAPVISADETRLIFTSRRPENIGEADELTGEYFEDIYIVEKDATGEWGLPQNMGKIINTDSHDASIALSPDGDQLYIYRAGPSTTSSRLSGDIYSSGLEEGVWTPPIKMPDGINSKYWEPHASVTANEEVLFFTSDRQDGTGKGGRDIYMVKRLPDLTWALPVNLEAINTPYDEDSPFIHPDGKTLYFSANGPSSMGGFDIFTSEYDEKMDAWSAPKNLGYPINTSGDDIYFVWSLDGERGYFSSEREDSHGEKDIYMVVFPEQRMKPIVLKGVVTDQQTQKPLGAVVEVFDNATQKLVSLVNANELTGKYAVILPPNKNYGVRVLRNGYLFHSININIPNQFEYLEIVENVELKPIAPNQFEELSNVFFGDDMGLRYESEAEVNELSEFQLALPDGYLIEVMVHSDNADDSVLNIFKTQAKADAVTTKMRDFAAESQNLIPTGAGSKFPAFSNQTVRGRAKNNRIEYILRKVGSEETDMAYQSELPKEGAEVGNPVRIVTNTLAGSDTLSSLVYKAKPGDLLIIKNKISFKTASSVLDESSHPALDEIADFLQNHPEIEGVELAGHTDDIGSDDFNRKLGLRRASVVTQQLIYRGVPESRIKVISYGESKPIASNTTPEGRAKNRRTEFKVLGKAGVVAVPTDDK